MLRKFVDSRLWLVGTAVLLAMGLFILLASSQSRAGFPLDDAWIHQTYARNLVRSGRWEFVPGMVSSGSTAPLWTLLLAVGYWLRLPYLLWAYLLGGLSLFWLAWAGMQLWRQLWPDEAQSAWLVGVTLALTWPLVWAAASGMETLLFAAIGLQTAVLSLRPHQTIRQLAVLGLLSGLLILTRPDGVVLVLLVGIRLVGQIGEWRFKINSNLFKSLIVFVGAMLLPLVPYFLLNWRASGTVWPNTFYAKQVEYGVLLARPLWARLWELLFYSWGGPQGSPHVLLLPGLIGAGWLALRQDWQEKRLYRLLPLLWAGGHVLVYAWRLPVTYQNGRYLLPIMPVWIVYGLAGWGMWVRLWAERGGSLQLLKLAANLIFALSMLIFLFIGGVQGYANDVALIEGEMVTVAYWLRENTEPEALIASHDIGAIGYFAERPLLDLAGLISPEVIEMLADESAISDYVLTTEADYLVTAPGWEYVGVATAVDVMSVFTTNYTWTLEQGINNMTVYKLP